MAPTNTSMLTHLTGPFILVLCAALDSITGGEHALSSMPSIGDVRYLSTQDCQLSISEKPVAFELVVHLHIVEGIPVGVGISEADQRGVMVTAVLLIVSGTPSFPQQMEATVALFVSQAAIEPKVLYGDYR